MVLCLVSGVNSVDILLLARYTHSYELSLPPHKVQHQSSQILHTSSNHNKNIKSSLFHVVGNRDNVRCNIRSMSHHFNAKPTRVRIRHLHLHASVRQSTSINHTSNLIENHDPAVQVTHMATMSTPPGPSRPTVGPSGVPSGRPIPLSSSQEAQVYVCHCPLVLPL